MEQIVNFNDSVTLADSERCMQSWRSIASVAAGLRARAEAPPNEARHREVAPFVPMMWAAE